MAAPKPPRVPAYRLHKPSNRAYVRISGRFFYLGAYDSAESREAYAAIIHDYLAGRPIGKQRRQPDERPAVATVSVRQLAERYNQHARAYYVKNGVVTAEAGIIAKALERTVALFSDLPAVEFGPLCLEQVRDAMIDEGLRRETINGSLRRIRRAFKCAAARELIPAATHHALTLVDGLKTGRSGAVESKPIEPVDDATVDSTTLEANAAMKSIVRRPGCGGTAGEDYREYVVALMREEGLVEEGEEPSDDDLRRFDKKRKSKKVSNEEWVSATDPDARITRMKDKRTHLAYKAEHAIDLETELILAAEVCHGDHSETQTLCDTAMAAQTHLSGAGRKERIEEVVADKGYHAGDQLELVEGLSVRTYIPEPQRRGESRLSEKSPEVQRAVKGNRRRTQTEKNSRLQRLRSERVERSFAHVCDTGGARRSWLRGIEKVHKRLLITAAARNLGLVMRKLFGVGKPRTLQDALATLLALLTAVINRLLQGPRWAKGW